MGKPHWVGVAATTVLMVACGRTFVTPVPDGGGGAVPEAVTGASSGGLFGAGGTPTGGWSRPDDPADEFGGYPFSGGLSSSGGYFAAGGTPATGGASSSGGSPASGGMTPPSCIRGVCEELLSYGEWAVVTELDVWWDAPSDARGTGAPGVNPGRGKVKVYQHVSISSRCLSAMGGPDGIARFCGLQLPTLTSELTCDAHAWSFDPATWESTNAPTFLSAISVGGAYAGDLVQLTPEAALIGIDMDDPERPAGEWPSAPEAASFTCQHGTQSGLACYPDHDGNGLPGITARVEHGEVASSLVERCGIFSDQPYIERAAALSLDPAALYPESDQGQTRAIAAHLGVRLRVGGGGIVSATCDSGEGDATATYLQTRVIACTRVDGTPCTAEQAAFLDEQTPEFRILQKGETPAWKSTFPAWTVSDTSESLGPRSRMVRIGDSGADVSCADVRRALQDP